jgi:hypothetical protein
MNKTYRKNYFISILNGEAIITKNPNPSLITFEDMTDLTKRYLYSEGDKILTPFGIQTIDIIDRNHSEQRGYEWLITVKENKNQYKPCELIGIYVQTLTEELFKSIIL